MIDLTKKLISIPSILGEKSDIADFIASELEKYGNVKVYDDGKFGKTIIAKSSVYSKNGIILASHMDTVRPMDGWKTNPFKPFERNNRIYGLGASDMKAGIAISMEIFKKFSKKKQLTFFCTGDEEGMSMCCYKNLDKIEGSVCLVPEPTNEKIMLGARGRYVIDIIIKGKSAHGARPYLGINAIEKAGEVIKNLKKIKFKKDKRLGEGSICPLKIFGGEDSLTVPEKCLIRVDRHFVFGENESFILDQIKRIINFRGAEVRLMERESPFLEPYISKGPYIKKFIELCAQDIFYGMSVGDYNLLAKKFPTIVFGPKGANWHSANEFVEIESIKRCKRIYEEYINGLI
ncbi:MAG: M20/M25/M40 family metallo-hydrolase [Candidatus Thermoplasmatota archaeon]